MGCGPQGGGPPQAFAYTTYLRRLANLDHDTSLMIEYCKGEKEYKQARQHLLNLVPRIGLSFG